MSHEVRDKRTYTTDTREMPTTFGSRRTKRNGASVCKYVCTNSDGSVGKKKIVSVSPHTRDYTWGVYDRETLHNISYILNFTPVNGEGEVFSTRLGHNHTDE